MTLIMVSATATGCSVQQLHGSRASVLPLSICAADGHHQELNDSDKEKLTRHYSAIEQAFMQKVTRTV